MDKRKVIYYQDELNDEFSTAQITPRVIDDNYLYVRDSFFGKLAHIFWLRAVFTPIAFFYSKFIARQRIVNKKLLKKFKFTGYFLYGNHTNDIGDALMPHFLNMPKHNYIIVHANNVSMPVLGKLTPHLGALPLPDTKGAYKNFISAIEQRVKEKNCVLIYPEAHIWPYYTKIRPFTDVSFTYPVKLDVPVFCFTNTYQKRRFSKKPCVVTYIDGPFYPNTDLSPKDQRKHLRDQVYECMCERAKNSNVEYIKYIRKEGNKQAND
ncbi:MAG: 1-acyl-sn-glycerol-3-phosphate acyltransferase [Clostridia bacterium]|nr:1-acyl-sn-glycerol-3-phosphate acyltransferase [Clostridia bacterium]